MKDVEIQRLTLDFHRKRSASGKVDWMKLAAKPLRPQVAPDNNFAVVTSNPQPQVTGAEGPRHIQSVKDTASEMEKAFRIEHNRDSTPQFCMSLQMCSIYLLVTIIYRAYNKEVYADKAARSARSYTIYSVTIVSLLTIVKLLRKYPRLARLKEKWGTGTGLVFIMALNIQLLAASDTSSLKDSQPRGSKRLPFWMEIYSTL